jgi:hypothetical protein
MLDKDHVERFDEIRYAHLINVLLILLVIIKVEPLIHDLVLDGFVLLDVLRPTHDNTDIAFTIKKAPRNTLLKRIGLIEQVVQVVNRIINQVQLSNHLPRCKIKIHLLRLS